MAVFDLQVRITFKNHELLRGINWDVKRGERVGLVGKLNDYPAISSVSSSSTLAVWLRAQRMLCCSQVWSTEHCTKNYIHSSVRDHIQGLSSHGKCFAGINGAGKTTQLQIISGVLSPDSGAVIKERPNMKIAYLTQEFDVEPTRTVRVRLCASGWHAHEHSPNLGLYT